MKLSAFTKNFTIKPKNNDRVDQKVSKKDHILKDDDPLKTASINEIISSSYGFENYVYQLFKNSGYIVGKETMLEGDRGVDLALWLETFEHSLGNPVIVQVKQQMNESTT